MTSQLSISSTILEIQEKLEELILLKYGKRTGPEYDDDEDEEEEDDDEEEEDEDDDAAEEDQNEVCGNSD